MKRCKRVALIIIGNEVLEGDAVDTNGAYIGNKLSHIGMEIVFKTTVRDRIEEIKSSLKMALSKADTVILTGGLGPTRDDVTREAVSGFLKKKLKFHFKSFENIKSFFRKRGGEVPSICKRQAFLPAGAKALENRCGTAPGFLIKHRSKLIVVLPGPPREMKPMFEKVISLLKRHLRGSAVVLRRALRTYGIGESSIEEGLRDIKNKKGFEIGFQAHPGHVDIKLCVRAKNENLARKIIKRYERKIFSRFKNNIFSRDDRRLEEVVGLALKRKGLTLAIAESCSGGLVSNLITNVPGASNYFEGGVISYSNRLKRKILEVPGVFLKRYGAVSGPVAERMAAGIRNLARTDLGLGITGIAGPSGGTKKKPVGLVYIALASASGVKSKKFNFYGERIEIKERVALASLSMLLEYLSEKEKKCSTLNC